MADLRGTGWAGALQGLGGTMTNISSAITEAERLKEEQKVRQQQFEMNNIKIGEAKIDRGAGFIKSFRDNIDRLDKIDPTGKLTKSAVTKGSNSLFNAFVDMGIDSGTSQVLSENFHIPQVQMTFSELLENYRAGKLRPDQLKDFSERIKTSSDINQYIKASKGQPVGDFSTSIKTPGEVDLSKPKTKSEIEESLRKEYTTNSKEFYAQAQAYNRIKESSKDPSPAGDLSLIFNYMKLLDPSSVVREGEFATAQNAGSVPDRVLAAYNKVIEGTRLADSQRKDFVDRSKRLYDGAIQINKPIQDFYRKQAQQYDLDVNNVIPPYTSGGGEDKSIKEIQNQIKAAEQYLKTPDGKADPDAPDIRKKIVELRQQLQMR